MNYKILLCLFVIAFFYGLGYFQKSASMSGFESPEKYTQGKNSSEPHPKFSPIAWPHLAKDDAEAIAEFNFLETSGAPLFTYLFGGEFQKTGSISSKSFEQLQERFAKPYSQKDYAHHGLAEKEAASRIAILKAWTQKSPSIHNNTLRKQVRDFYEKVAANKSENIFVRRQALKGFPIVANGLSESETWKMHANQDRQVRGLASLSDSDIIEALLEK